MQKKKEMSNLLYDLPRELICKIYEYDDTYKEKINKEISPEIKKRIPCMESAFFKLVPVDDYNDNRDNDEADRAAYWLSLGTNAIINHRDRYKKYPTTITKSPIGVIMYGYKLKYGLYKEDYYYINYAMKNTNVK